jgi:hypothetical protein
MGHLSASLLGGISEMDNRKYILNTPNSRWKKWKSSSSAQMETKKYEKKTPKKNVTILVFLFG